MLLKDEGIGLEILNYLFKRVELLKIYRVSFGIEDFLNIIFIIGYY